VHFGTAWAALYFVKCTRKLGLGDGSLSLISNLSHRFANRGALGRLGLRLKMNRYYSQLLISNNLHFR